MGTIHGWGEEVKLMVIDGQGGGIGATIIRGLRESVGNEVEILALGTNSIATSRMMKAGANKGATGENAVERTIRIVDVVIGPLSIIMADSMMGELTPKMAAAVSSSEVKKLLIPLTQENVEIVGGVGEPLPHLVARVVETIKEMKENV